MITITITGESSSEVLREIIGLAQQGVQMQGSGEAIQVNIADVEKEVKKTTRSKKTESAPAPEETVKEKTPAGPKFEDLQELNAQVENKLDVKKLVNSFFYTNEAGESVMCERMTQLEQKDYVPYAAGVQLLIDTQV